MDSAESLFENVAQPGSAPRVPTLMSLRAPTRLLLLTGLVALAGCAEKERPGTPPEHVLLFTFEDLRADHVSSLAYVRPTTFGAPADPNFTRKPGLDFDAIADAGVQFAECYAPSGEMRPALASLLTGLTPRSTGLAGDTDDPRPDLPWLAETFRAGGFHTIASVTVTPEERERFQRDFHSGFDVFQPNAHDLDTVSQAWFHAKAALENPDVRRILVWIHFAEIRPPFEPRDLPDVVTERDLRTAFSDPAYTGSVRADAATFAALERGELELSLADRDQIVSLYDGEVATAAALFRAFLERWVYTVRDSFGTYVEADHEDERWAKTLVVGCGTSGVELGEGRGFGDTGSLHSSSLRVPLFFSHPASLTGKRIYAELVELEDVAPTLHDWLELEAPAGVEGRSLLPIVDSYVRREFASRPAFGMRGEPEGFTVRDSRWRLIVEGDRVRLFDCERDPREHVDVAARHRDVVERLRAELDAWRRGSGP